MMDVFEDDISTASSTDLQLIRLFETCDRSTKGYIVREELEELCLGLGISNGDSDTLFCDLDADNDGKISFDDFSSGFKEFLTPEEKRYSTRRRTSIWATNIETNINYDQDSSSKSYENCTDSGAECEGIVGDDQDKRRRSCVFNAWTTFTTSLVDSNLLSLSPESQLKVRQLYDELQCKSIPANVATKVECAVSSLMKEMEQLKMQNQTLEELYNKEKETHVQALNTLGEEIEDQVAKMEERTKAKIQIEQEEEKRKLRDQMETEVAQMQAQLKIFQKVDKWVKNEDGSASDRVKTYRKKMEESSSKNKELQMALGDTTTNLAILRTDLAESRLQYEEKCKELHEEREQVMEYMQQHGLLRRQLDLIHDANKRLQDTNDNMRENFESEWRYASPLSRASSFRSSRKYKQNTSTSPPPTHFREPLGSVTSTSSFGIKRLLDDLDKSGLSTIQNQNGERLDCISGFVDVNGPPSLEEELRNSGEMFDESEQSPKHSPVISPTETSKKSPIICGTQFNPEPERVMPIKTQQPIQTMLQPAKVPSPKQLRRAAHRRAAGINNSNHSGALGPPDRTYKVVLAGDAAVGKSTFIARVCEGVFVNNMSSTLGVDYKVKSMMVDEKHMVIQLWDTAGQERFRSITKSYFRRADGVLLLYDLTSERSFTNVRQWVQSIDECCENRVPLVLCGNKADLRGDFEKRGFPTVNYEEGERLAEECEASFFETSPKTGMNVAEAIVDLARQMAASEDVAIESSSLRLVTGKNKTKCCLVPDN